MACPLNLPDSEGLGDNPDLKMLCSSYMKLKSQVNKPSLSDDNLMAQRGKIQTEATDSNWGSQRVSSQYKGKAMPASFLQWLASLGTGGSNH